MIKKILKSDNIQSLAGNGVSALLSMVTFIIMVQYLDKETYGHWIIFITSVTLLNMLRVGLTGTATVRLLSTQNKEEHSQIISSLYKINVFFSVLTSIMFYIIYLSLGYHFPESYYMAVLIYYPILGIVELPFFNALTICQGKSDFKTILKIFK